MTSTSDTIKNCPDCAGPLFTDILIEQDGSDWDCTLCADCGETVGRRPLGTAMVTSEQLLGGAW